MLHVGIMPRVHDFRADLRAIPFLGIAISRANTRETKTGPLGAALVDLTCVIGSRPELRQQAGMKVFLDFEASSLSKHSYPIEVAWVFQDGRSESHLIAPAPGWDDWSEAAEAIHGISRDLLRKEGEPHDAVANRMVEALGGHDLFASAPSWDGKWLSYLLRTSGFPRHSLRLRDTDEALRETATEILGAALSDAQLSLEVRTIVSRVDAARAGAPAHRALADAIGEYERWVGASDAAHALLRPAD